MHEVDAVLLRLSRTLSSAGYQEEMFDVSVQELGFAPQSRSRRKRLRLLARYRVMVSEIFGVEHLRHFDR